MNCGLGSVGGFLPTIVKVRELPSAHLVQTLTPIFFHPSQGLGYTNAEAQLYTVPPYAVSPLAHSACSSYADLPSLS